MDHQAEVEVGPQLLDTLPVLNHKWSCLTHHQVNHHTVGGETVAACCRGCWELDIALLELFSISEGHGCSSGFNCNQLRHLLGHSSSTGFDFVHDVEWRDAVHDKFSSQGQCISMECIKDLG